jgi:hypothetical protein
MGIARRVKNDMAAAIGRSRGIAGRQNPKGRIPERVPRRLQQLSEVAVVPNRGGLAHAIQAVDPADHIPKIANRPELSSRLSSAIPAIHAQQDLVQPPSCIFRGRLFEGSVMAPGGTVFEKQGSGGRHETEDPENWGAYGVSGGHPIWVATPSAIASWADVACSPLAESNSPRADSHPGWARCTPDRPQMRRSAYSPPPRPEGRSSTFLHPNAVKRYKSVKIIPLITLSDMQSSLSWRRGCRLDPAYPLSP